jgi:hypothetical protein
MKVVKITKDNTTTKPLNQNNIVVVAHWCFNTLSQTCRRRNDNNYFF